MNNIYRKFFFVCLFCLVWFRFSSFQIGRPMGGGRKEEWEGLQATAPDFKTNIIWKKNWEGGGGNHNKS